MFEWIVIVDIEHWEIWERYEWLNIVLMLKEYLLKWSETIAIVKQCPSWPNKAIIK